MVPNAEDLVVPCQGHFFFFWFHLFNVGQKLVNTDSVVVKKNTEITENIPIPIEPPLTRDPLNLGSENKIIHVRSSNKKLFKEI